MKDGNKTLLLVSKERSEGSGRNLPHTVQYTVMPDHVGVCLELINICVQACHRSNYM